MGLPAARLTWMRVSKSRHKQRTPEHLHLKCAIHEILVIPAPRHLAEQIEISEIRLQSEIQTHADGGFRPLKGKSRRGAAQIGVLFFQCVGKARDILLRPAIYHVEVLCQTTAAVNDSRRAPDDDKFNAAIGQ